MECPICRSKKFIERSGRPNAQCGSCRSMERTRLIYLSIKKKNVLKPNIKILHLEPELSLLREFYRLFPLSYYPFTCQMESYSDIEPLKIYGFNSFRDIQELPLNSFDLIVHSHFIETVPFPLEYLLNVLQSLLRPGGHHIFNCYISKGFTDSSYSLIAKERLEKFGQENRMHRIGIDDFIPMLQNLWNSEKVYVSNEELIGLEDYLQAALPEYLFKGVNSSTVFCQVANN